MNRFHLFECPIRMKYNAAIFSVFEIANRKVKHSFKDY
jgi:hypothetical protein